MPIRIYALAKELKIDSKDLADLCVKAGIPGKGSALASLDDDEVVKLKAYLAGPTKKAPPPAARPLEPIPPGGPSFFPPAPGPNVKLATPAEREKVAQAAKLAEASPVPVTPPVSEPITPEVPPTVVAEAAPVAPPPAPEVAAEASSVESTPPPPPAPTAPAAPPTAPTIRRPGPGTGTAPPSNVPIRPGSTPAPFTRGDYIPPTGSTQRMKVLDTRTKRAAEQRPGAEGDTSRPARRREPGININLPKMPELKAPPPSARSAELPAQKPVMRLPKDGLKGKAGIRAPLEHLTPKGDQQRRPKGPGDRGLEPGPEIPDLLEAGGAKPGGKPVRKGGKPGAPAEGADGDLAGMSGSRLDRQKARKARAQEKQVPGFEEDMSPAARRARRLTRRSSGVSTAAPRKERQSLVVPCTVRSFCEATGVPSGQLLKTLLTMGMPVNINASLTMDMVELLSAELNLDVEIRAAESAEDALLAKLKNTQDDPALLKTRPPVVTFLGHVDHGKTSLLDRIIGIDVVSGEAGGITQHIRAYSIAKDGRRISFVDTPGHEAFTEMRARGANVTDIAVLVVAADDGLMPQTEEAISHAKAANVPIVVALNKMDLPGANPDRVLQQLATLGIMPSEWSGDTEVIRCSALTGQGIDNLLETLLITADLHEYKANPKRAALGVCLEAEQEPGRGVIAKLMVKNGTLNVGDIVVCGNSHGRVKAMYDTLKKNERVKSAGPSMPVNVTGLDLVPQAGEAFYVLPDIAQARDLALRRGQQMRDSTIAGTARVSFEKFQQLVADGRLTERQEAVTLNLIIRADVRGSIEAIQKELSKFSHPEVQVKILQAAVGGITVADVTLAHASDAVIVGFNVIPDEAARTLADERQVEIRRYDIIYKVTDDIKAMLEGKLKPEERVVRLGHAIVKQTFVISRVGTVAGCYVADGKVERGARIRVFRDGKIVGEYPIDSLRREKEDVREVNRGMECGIRLVGFNDVKRDDVLEAYKVEEVARTL